MGVLMDEFFRNLKGIVNDDINGGRKGPRK